VVESGLLIWLAEKKSRQSAYWQLKELVSLGSMGRGWTSKFL